MGLPALNSRFAVALATTLAIAIVFAIAPAAHAQTAVPQGFVGMDVDGPLYPSPAPGVDVGQQYDEMVGVGVENIRTVFDWSFAQRYHKWSQVPSSDRSQFVNVGGVPTDFSQTDAIVGLAAQRGITVLPIVIYAPGWDAAAVPAGEVPIPKRLGPYAGYLKALIARYGPHGTFWSTQSTAEPIREWQIWNEPSVAYFWPERHFAQTYVGLLRVAHKAIKRADPGAKVVLAGLPNYSWQDLAKIYAVRGAAQLFDVVAIHPYTKQPQGVITILGFVRQTMNRAGDGRKPILATEISWPSSLGKTSHNTNYDFATTEKGQARNIRAVFPLLAANRIRLNLIGFDWDTWAGFERRNALAFDFAGLLRYRNGQLTRKPALSAYQQAALAIEGCRQKGPMANICLSPS